VAEALSPAPPHQSGRSVFPNTAFQLSSSSGFYRTEPRSGLGHLVKTKDVVVIATWIGLVAKAAIMVLPAYVCPHPVTQVVPQSRHGFRAVTVVEVADPSSHDLIDPPYYDVCRRRTIPFSGQLLDP
jgi:hypothetical protein